MVSSVKEAKELVAAEKAKVTSALAAITGSRVAMAVAAVLTVGFGAHAIYSPTRLPPIGGLSLAQVGLPPLDFGLLGQGVRDASDAAIREGAPTHVAAFVAEHQDWVPVANVIGFGVCLLLLLWTFRIQARKWRTGGA
jgi:hypothetical protein